MRSPLPSWNHFLPFLESSATLCVPSRTTHLHEGPGFPKRPAGCAAHLSLLPSQYRGSYSMASAPSPRSPLSWMPLPSQAHPGEPLSPAVTPGQWFSADGDFASKETSGDVWGHFRLKPLEEGHCWYLVGGPTMLPNLLQGAG